MKNIPGEVMTVVVMKIKNEYHFYLFFLLLDWTICCKASAINNATLTNDCKQHNHQACNVNYCTQCWWKRLTTIKDDITHQTSFDQYCLCNRKHNQERVILCEKLNKIVYACLYCNSLQDTHFVYHAQIINDLKFNFLPFVSCPKRSFPLFIQNQRKTKCLLCRSTKAKSKTFGLVWICEKCENQTLHFKQTDKTIIPFIIREKPGLIPLARDFIAWKCPFCTTSYFECFDDKFKIDMHFKCMYCCSFSPPN